MRLMCFRLCRINLKYYYIKYILLFIPLLFVVQVYIKNIEINKIHWQEVLDELNKSIIIQNNTQLEFISLLLETKKTKLKFPILVFGCNRPTIRRTLDQLLKYRPSEELFPIYASLGCPSYDLEKILKSYGEKITLLKHKQRHIPNDVGQWQKGYYHIAYHYKWALGLVFGTLNSTKNAIIVVEDDFDIAPDFFEYFTATYPLLIRDPTIWCVSSWNDNGLTNLTLNDPRLLYRTDFFPGLGWMLTKELWLELEPKWPDAYWDDWMRDSAQRKGRVCVRPEISRVYTFGDSGVSKGQYFENHLSKIRLNTDFVPFSREEGLIQSLVKERYDASFLANVSKSTVMKYNDLLNIPGDDTIENKSWEWRRLTHSIEPSYSLEYENEGDFKILANLFGLMSDYRGGVARTSYLGIVTFILRGHRIYLVPPRNESTISKST